MRDEWHGGKCVGVARILQVEWISMITGRRIDSDYIASVLTRAAFKLRLQV